MLKVKKLLYVVSIGLVAASGCCFPIPKLPKLPLCTECINNIIENVANLVNIATAFSGTTT